MWVAVLAVIVGVLAYYLRSELVSWLLIIVFMVQVTSVAYFSKTEEVYYREFNYYLYSAVKVRLCLVACLFKNGSVGFAQGFPKSRKENVFFSNISM